MPEPACSGSLKRGARWCALFAAGGILLSPGCASSTSAGATGPDRPAAKAPRAVASAVATGSSERGKTQRERTDNKASALDSGSTGDPENNPKLGRPTNPCSFVSPTLARSLIGEPIRAPVEAPQGPTCIYESIRNRTFVTISLATTDFNKARAQLKRPSNVRGIGQQAVCGVQGQSKLIVKLRAGVVMTVAGPCSIARRFAAAAVPNVGTPTVASVPVS